MYASTRNPWFCLVTGQDWFWEMVQAKWADMKDHDLLENTLEFLNAEKDTYKDYYIHNYERWSQRVIDGNTECNSTLQSYRDPKTAQGLAADWLIDWITKRFAYLDSQWGSGDFGQIKVDENLPAGSVAYRYEAEHAALGNFTVAEPIRKDRDYASNREYIGNVGSGTTITFTVTASEATTAYLFAGVSKLSSAGDFASWFRVTVNGVDLYVPYRPIPAVSGGEEVWHTFIPVKLAPIDLNKGENVITFTTISGSNFDYIDVYSAKALS
jgi:hypothetical protein